MQQQKNVTCKKFVTHLSASIHDRSADYNWAYYTQIVRNVPLKSASGVIFILLTRNLGLISSFSM